MVDVLAQLKSRGVPLRILAMGIDTGTPTGKLILMILGGVADFEREIILERQREGIANAKAEGRYKCRAPTARFKVNEVFALHQQGIGGTKAAKGLGIGRASAYRILDRVKGSAAVSA